MDPVEETKTLDGEQPQAQENDVIYHPRTKGFSLKHSGNRIIIEFGRRVMAQNPDITNEALQERIFDEVTLKEPPGRFLSQLGQKEIREIRDESMIDKKLVELVRVIKREPMHSRGSLIPNNKDDPIHDNDVICTYTSKNRLAAKHTGTMQFKDLILNRTDLEGKALVKFIRNEVSNREPPGRFYFFFQKTKQFLVEHNDELITRRISQYIRKTRRETSQVSNALVQTQSKNDLQVHDNDVLCNFISMEQITLQHPGTRRFKEFSRDFVLNRMNMEENNLIQCIRDEVSRREPPGRFLYYNRKTKHYAVGDDAMIQRRIRQQIERIRDKTMKDSNPKTKSQPKLDPSDVHDNDVLWLCAKIDRLMASHPGTHQFQLEALSLVRHRLNTCNKELVESIREEVAKREPSGRFLLYNKQENYYEVLDDDRMLKNINNTLLEAKKLTAAIPQSTQNGRSQCNSKLRLFAANDNDVVIHFTGNRMIKSHFGTQQFLGLAEEFARNRLDVTKHDLVKCICDEVKKREPPGRFLYFVEEFGHYEIMEERLLYKKIFHIITQTRRLMRLEENSRCLSVFEPVVKVHQNDVLYSNRRLDERHSGSRRCRDICESFARKFHGDRKKHHIEKIFKEVMHGEPPSRFVHYDVRNNKCVLMDKAEAFRKLRQLLKNVDDALQTEEQNNDGQDGDTGSASSESKTIAEAVTSGSHTINVSDHKTEQPTPKWSTFELRYSDVLYKGRALNSRHHGSVVFREWCENFIIDNFELIREIAVAQILDMLANQQPPGRFVLYCEKKKEYEVMNEELAKKKITLFIKGFKQRYRQKRQIQAVHGARMTNIGHDQSQNWTKSRTEVEGAVTVNRTHQTSKKRKFHQTLTDRDNAQEDSEQTGNHPRLVKQATESELPSRIVEQLPYSGVTVDNEAIQAAKSLQTLFHNLEMIHVEYQVHQHPKDMIQENQDATLKKKVHPTPLFALRNSRKQPEATSENSNDEGVEMDSNDDRSISEELDSNESSTDGSSTCTDESSTAASYESIDSRLDFNGSVGRSDTVPCSVLSSVVVDRNTDSEESGLGSNQVNPPLPTVRRHIVAAATIEEAARQVCQNLQQASLGEALQSRSYGGISICVKHAFQEAQKLLQQVVLTTEEEDFESADERDQYMSIFHMLEDALDECFQSCEHANFEEEAAEDGSENSDEEFTHDDRDEDDDQNQDCQADWEENLPSRIFKAERLNEDLQIAETMIL